MLEKPKTYEEAKQIIEEVNNNRKFKNITYNPLRLRAALIAAGGTGAAYAIGYLAQRPVITEAVLPFIGVFTLASLFPLFGLKKVQREIKNGVFFEEHTPKEIMELAEDYVVAYNRFEAKKEKKSI